MLYILLRCSPRTTPTPSSRCPNTASTPLPRHPDTTPTSSHATLTPYAASTPLPRRPHAAQALLQRHPHAVSTPPQRRSKSRRNATLTPSSCPLYAAPLHAALTPPSLWLKASFTLSAHRSHTAATPPQPRPHAAARCPRATACGPHTAVAPPSRVTQPSRCCSLSPRPPPCPPISPYTTPQRSSHAAAPRTAACSPHTAVAGPGGGAG